MKNDSLDSFHPKSRNRGIPWKPLETLFAFYYLYMRYAIFFILAILPLVFAEKHAIIIAPRYFWWDYGVQSESCRMYKDLVAGGVKPENIILMSTKIISENRRNPFPGELFTDDSPDAPGKDYSNGCIEHIDYDEMHMKPDVMLAIMRGDVQELKSLTHKENPRALKSTAEDDVLLYFTSHGGEGSVVVGRDDLSREKFQKTVKYMYDNKMYKHFLILMEACYSGSMFDNFPANLNVYAITAADGKHPSYESHCPPDDVVDGKSIDACLSCWWDNSMEWFMEGGADHTLDELYEHTHAKVAEQTDQNTSHFGDIEEMGKMTLRTFLGDLPSRRFRSIRNDDSAKIAKAEVPTHLAMWKAIRADKKDLAAALKEYQEAKFVAAKKEIEVMRLGRMLMNEKAADMALKAPAEMYSADCVRELTRAFVKNCGHTYPFPESTLNMIKNICLPGMSVPNVDFKDVCF